MKLTQLDALKPDDIPEEFVGAFDVVNVRIMITIFSHGDPGVFLQTVGKMLKKGGWMRWVENRDIGENMSVISLVPGRKMEGAEKCVGVIKGFYKTRAIKPE